MSLGTKTLTGGEGTTELLAADEYRDCVLIQVQNDNDVYLGFGESAVTVSGICLLEPGATVKVTGTKARGVINVLSAGAALIGYETKGEIEYRPGQFAGPWPVS